MTSPIPSLTLLSSQLADLVERSAAFVVSVDGRPRRPSSGLMFGPEHVVTAEHTLERDDVIVRDGNRQLRATVIGRDPASDIAVLRVPELGGTQPPPGDSVRVGQLVVSVARTSSGGVSAAAGLVTSTGGPLRTGGGVILRQVLRTDAAARPGTSGGAIVDAGGGVIAMTTSGLLRGVPVGVPAAQLWEIASALAAGRPVARAYLGVSVQPVRLPRPAANGTAGGLLVFGVAPDGAADRAGVLVGDVIVAFEDETLAHAEDLQDRLSRRDAGAPVALGILRGGHPQRLDVTLGARPSA